MYDINRSNMLSVESLKMYLYDISMLANAKADLDQKINVLTEEKDTYGKERKFNNYPFSRKKVSISYFMGKFFWAMILMVCVMSWAYLIFPEELDNLLRKLLIYMHYGWVRFRKNGMLYFIIIIVITVSVILASIFCIYLHCQNLIKKIRENKAREIFEVEDRNRREREHARIQSIDAEFSELQQKAECIQKEIDAQFQLEILHESYQDTEACGIMFQLLDTGRVDTLIDAMNMYEDLKWKSEMKEMMQSMLEKASQIIKQQKNMEHYLKCIISNQQETERILHGISINQSNIAINEQAIQLNTAIIASNTNALAVLGELGFI